MVELNSQLRRVLKVIRRYDGVDGFIGKIHESGARLGGMDPETVRRGANELEDMGLVRVFLLDDGKGCGIGDCRIELTSDAVSYFRDRRAKAARALLDRLFQLLVGACGGLAVSLASWLLSK